MSLCTVTHCASLYVINDTLCIIVGDLCVQKCWQSSIEEACSQYILHRQQSILQSSILCTLTSHFGRNKLIPKSAFITSKHCIAVRMRQIARGLLATRQSVVCPSRRQQHEAATATDQPSSLKQFQDIPGPKNIPLLGNFLNFKHPKYGLDPK